MDRKWTQDYESAIYPIDRKSSIEDKLQPSEYDKDIEDLYSIVSAEQL